MKAGVNIKLLDTLDEKEQIELFKEYNKTSSPGIREKLILYNLKLVAWTIRRYYDINILEYDDYFQIGTIGLMKAIEGYDYNIGAFSTYSIYLIRQAIERDIQNYGRTIRVPSYMLENIHKIKTIKEELSQLFNREPSLEEISHASEIPINEVKEILNVIDDPVSLNLFMSANDDSTTLEGAIKDDSPTPAELTETKLFIEGFKKESKKVLTGLQYNILIMNIGIGTREHTLVEIGNIYNHNKEYIRIHRDKALGILRRTKNIRELWDKVEDNTIYYKSVDYTQPRVFGGLPSSSVENIVIERERQFNELDKGYHESW